MRWLRFDVRCALAAGFEGTPMNHFGKRVGGLYVHDKPGAVTLL